MQSALAEALRLETQPVALLFTDDRPEEAAQFEKGRWGCVMSMFAAATKGRTTAFDRDTFGCFGGGVGLGFGNVYEQFPGGVPGFCRFLADGNDKDPAGRAIGEGMKAAGARGDFVEHFIHGERYKKNPQLVEEFVKAVPIIQVPAQYVLFMPLSKVPEGTEAVSVSFLVDPDRLSALVILANYDRPGLENCAIPYVAACQTVGILGYREAQSPNPRGLVGLVDLSARNYLRAHGRDLMTFTLPYRRFLELEREVPGSFLEGGTWTSLVEG